jgi:O-antigen ligase
VSLFLMAEWIFLIFARGVNFLKDPGVIERVEGYKLSFEMLKQNPLGIGYNHYTLFMDQWSQTNLMPWEYQPVHNGFMLILIEQGWIGFFLLSILTLYIFSKLYQKRKKLLTRGQRFKKRILMVCFISLFLISLFDHYLITLQQGQYLVVMIFAVASVFSLNPRKVLPIRKGDGLRKILTDRR